MQNNKEKMLMGSLIKYGIPAAALVLILGLAFFGCAGKGGMEQSDELEVDQSAQDVAEETEDPSSDEYAEYEGDKEADEQDSTVLPGEEAPNHDEVRGRRDINRAPSYALLERSMRYHERRLGVEFYRNKLGRYSFYSVAAWDGFSISDKQGECLYDVEVLGVQNYRHLDGKREVMLDLEVLPGPCNLRYPNTDADAADRVSSMEGTVVSPRLLDRLGGGGMCSDIKFLQEVLQLPYRLETAADDVEGSIDRIARPVKNPGYLRFGDLVFFSPYPEERAVGVYVGYGLVVYNSCFSGKSHKMRPGGDYRIYRLYEGFAWTRYRIHQEKFLQEYVGVPE